MIGSESANKAAKRIHDFQSQPYESGGRKRRLEAQHDASQSCKRLKELTNGIPNDPGQATALVPSLVGKARGLSGSVEVPHNNSSSTWVRERATLSDTLSTGNNIVAGMLILLCACAFVDTLLKSGPATICWTPVSASSSSRTFPSRQIQCPDYYCMSGHDWPRYIIRRSWENIRAR